MRLLARVSYDGTRYRGYQVQPNQLTVQAVIEAALTRIHKGEEIRITASGRTDAGVHALGQAFHFDSTLRIPEGNWVRAMNSQLPDDIVITDVHQVADDFHARFNVIEKWYEYRMYNTTLIDPFKRHYSHYVKMPLDVALMNQACQYLVGTHDFTAFCASKSNVKDSKVRTIFHATCEYQANEVVFTISGSGFLYNMVRIIVGSLIDVGQGRKPPEVIQEALHNFDRNTLGKTAPAKGLYLKHVVYDKNEKKF